MVRARPETDKPLLPLVLGAIGAGILTGADKWVEARVLNCLPTAWINLTVGI